VGRSLEWRSPKGVYPKNVTMKLIRSLVRPCKLDDVKQALDRLGVSAVNVAETRDHSPQRHETAVWKGREYTLGFSNKLQIEVIVHDHDVDDVVEAIIKTARTGQKGDGHVIVMAVDHRYSICDGLRSVE
jgi:nitrogen regulatory protein P-II 1